MTIVQENAARRELFCRPLTRSVENDDLFFCTLGTLWCTEAHGDSWEVPYVNGADGQAELRARHPSRPRRLALAWRRFADHMAPTGTSEW